MRNIETWKSRYTVKEFTGKEIEPNDVEYLSEIFQYIPIQQGMLNHFWLMLGPEEQDFKTFLYENVFHVKDKSEHMYAVASSPYVFLGVFHQQGLVGKDGKMSHVSTHESIINLGFHGGVLLTEALHLGYDVSQVACQEGIDKSRSEFNQRVRDFLSEEDVKKLMFHPARLHKAEFQPKLAICIGKGLPLSSNANNTVIRDGLPARIGQKMKKPATNLVIRKSVNE